VLQALAVNVKLAFHQLRKRNKNAQGAPEMTPLDELAALRRRVVGLEIAEAQYKSAEEVLRKSAEEIKDLYNKAPCGYHSLDKNGVLVRINDTELAWLGYTRDEIIGKKLTEIITPESRKTFQATFPILRQRGWVKDLELELVRKDGSVMPVLISASAILDEKGDYLMSRSTVYDITERKQAEKALRESRELYWALFTGCPQGILMADIQTHRFLYANPAICRMLGYTEAELLQLRVADIHPAEALAQVEADFAAMVRDEKISVEATPCRRKDSAVLFTDITAARLHVAGQEDVVVGFFADVTERKRTEEAREQSVSLLRATLESTADGILVVDSHGKIVGFNKRFTQLWHIPETIITSRSIQQVRAFILDQLKDPEGFLAKVNQLYAQPEAESFDTLEFKDGRLFERYSLPQRIEGRPVGRVWSFRDVTERKRAEASLRVEKERLERASIAGNIALWEWDMTTGRLEWSSTVDSMLGYEHGTFPRTLQKWEEIVHPDDRDLEFQVLEKHLEKGTPYDVEYRVKRKDGSYIWWHDMGACRRDKQGKAYQMSGVCIDVTERKRTEEALRESEKRYRLLFEGISDGVFVHDITNDDLPGRFLAVNDTICQRLGYTREELLRLTVRDIDAPESTVDPRAIMERLKRNKKLLFQQTHVAKDGRRIPVEINAQIFQMQDRVVILSVIRDITERKQAEEAKRISEERIVKLSSLKHQLLGAGGINKKLKLITDGAVSIFGADFARIWLIKEADLCKNGCRHATVTEGPNVCRDRNHCLHLIASSGRYTRIDGTHRRVPFGCYKIGRVASGEEEKFITNDVTNDLRVHDRDWARSLGLVSFAGYRLVSTDGKPIGVLALFSKQAILPDVEHLLEDLANVASQVVIAESMEEERRNLEVQMQQAQKLESLGILAGGIAHDFNNLLTVILGHANLALADLSPESPARENLLEIDSASHRAAELCRQMLAYSGRGSFVMKLINLSRLAQELIHMLQVSISKKAMLRCDFEENLPSIEADPAQVRQVVMNLVINASEAIGSKEGIISISTGSIQCDQTYLHESYPIKPPPPGKYVYIEVADTGCGIDSKTLPKIFEPFFTTKFTGRGLGLAAVIGIMRQHKGAIKITSEPGKGSTFRVLFPASSNTDTHPEAGVPPKLWRGGGTILVVEDEAEVLNVAKIMLERHGFHVLAATDGREAIKLFQKHGRNIVCVLLDMTMPHMDGEETYRELRRIRKDVQVIIASGYSEQEITKRFADHQPAGFIEKPYEAMALMAKLREALGEP
jgi:PAS domain S-box-containing protein